MKNFEILQELPKRDRDMSRCYWKNVGNRLDTGLPQNFSLKKTQDLQSAINGSSIKRGLPLNVKYLSSLFILMTCLNVEIAIFRVFSVQLIIKLNLPISFDFFNVTTRKLKGTYVTCVVLLLDSAGWPQILCSVPRQSTVWSCLSSSTFYRTWLPRPSHSQTLRDKPLLLPPSLSLSI